MKGKENYSRKRILRQVQFSQVPSSHQDSHWHINRERKQQPGCCVKAQTFSRDLQKHANKPLGALTTGQDSPGTTGTMNEASERNVEESSQLSGAARSLQTAWTRFRHRSGGHFPGNLMLCLSEQRPHAAGVCCPPVSDGTPGTQLRTGKSTATFPARLDLPALFTC